MSAPRFIFPNPRSLVVGSFGDAALLACATPASLAESCDIAEIRLDLHQGEVAERGREIWQHLLPFPLLFTARRSSEGSPCDLDAGQRAALLATSLGDASLIDIEVASIPEMSGIINEAAERTLPWIASFHDFEKLPERSILEGAAEKAVVAGAAAFKVAAMLRTVDDLTALAHFQTGGAGIPLSTMGMGVLAPVSRLLCAQSGSVLNYGYIGGRPTAPGQWSARRLRESMLTLSPVSQIQHARRLHS